MVIGIVVGTYSSIYVAAPTLWLLESRYGKDQKKPAPAKPTKGGTKAARA
jgi:preprotein translocase subunit SecF